MTALDVYFHSEHVGRLERLDGARLRFAYDPAWVAEAGATPLSLCLPLRAEPYDDAGCRPFFSGLLPEGEFLRAIARVLHVSDRNPFSLLSEIGGECAGAVALAAPGVEPPFSSSRAPIWLDGNKLRVLLSELPNRPLLAGLDDDEGLRLSLAGARDKLPLLALSRQLGITHGQPPSTHFLKVPVPDLSGMVVNEAFCLALAQAAGLSAAEAEPIQAGEQEALLVTRDDRSVDGESVHRIHQEDFCQALGLLPEQKYEADGGPSVSTCAALLRAHSAAPAVDLLTFLDALIFNLLIGNADAHAKNYSLLLEGQGAPRLAPLYDLLSIRVYGRRLGRKMAMKYGGEYRPDRIRGRHLDRLAADLEMTTSSVRVRVNDLLYRIQGSCSAARERLPPAWRDAPVLEEIEQVVSGMARRLEVAAAEPA